VEHLENPPESDPYAERLEFVTADPVALLRVTMGEASEHLETIRGHQRKAADTIFGGDVNLSLAEIQAALEGWTSIRAAIELVLNALGASAALEPRETLESALSDLAGELSALRDSLEAQDWSSVADALEGELDEQATRWRDWFEAHSARLSG